MNPIAARKNITQVTTMHQNATRHVRDPGIDRLNARNLNNLAGASSASALGRSYPYRPEPDEQAPVQPQ